MTEAFLKAKNPVISVFGLGGSNISALRYLLPRLAGIPTLYLRSEVPPEDSAVRAFPFSRIFLGREAFLDTNEDLMLLSPSVRRDRCELVCAARRGVVLSSDLELYFSLRPPRLAYGVTGSDGKSTTAYLSASILTKSGTPAEACGNFGLSPLELSADITPVLELSSFQLSFISPPLYRGLITNIKPNHLDWHKDFSEYKDAKLKILENAESFVFDYDDPVSRGLLTECSPFAVVSLELTLARLKELCKAEHYITKADGEIDVDGSMRIPLSAAKRREGHIIKDFMLSLGLCLDRATADGMEQAIDSFVGLPHRAELVATKDCIDYINSSIDTTPDRTLCTLRSFTSDTVVILCGKSKGVSYKELAELLPSLTASAVLMGEVGEIIEGELRQAKAFNYPRIHCEELSDAIYSARELLARAGYSSGRILFSPSGTSFDRYKNFARRGDAFRLAVSRIINIKDIEK